MNSPENLRLPRSFPGGWLRRLRASDLTAFQAYRTLPELGRFQGWESTSDAQALEFLIAMESSPLFAPGHWIQLGIAVPATDTLIGDVGLYLSGDAKTGEVGITLAPWAQGRGIASAAVRTALQLLFTATPVLRVVGIADTRNHASIRLLNRLGFQAWEIRSATLRGEACREQVFLLPREAAKPGGEPLA